MGKKVVVSYTQAMEATMGIGEARAKFSELVNRARYSAQVTVVTSRGRPVADLVPHDWYEAAKAAIGEPGSTKPSRKR